MATESSSSSGLDVAIIGCGIVGVQVGLGLLKRNIKVTLYEQASEHREIGAGLGFMPPASYCMQELDPRIWEIVLRIGVRQDDPMRFKDGSIQDKVGLRPEEAGSRSRDEMYDMEVSIPGLHVLFCHRAALLSELVKLLPPGVLRLGRRLEGLDQNTSDGRVAMTFSNGEQVMADAVIGCDGLKSKVRKLVLDPDDPAATSRYTHESAYRCLVDMEKASAALGALSRTFCCWCGPGAQVITYPIHDYKYLNVGAMVRDRDGDASTWPDKNQQLVPASRAEMAEAFAGFGPTIRALIDVLPEQQSRWGMFDTLEHPLATFAYGSVSLAGDAAHASTPHHGYGASSGVEDALVLASVLERVQTILANDKDKGSYKDESSPSAASRRQHAIRAAFTTYDAVRRERAQWIVASSRRQGRLYKMEIPEIGNDYAKFEKDAEERLLKIVKYDWKQMVAKAVEAVDAALLP